MHQLTKTGRLLLMLPIALSSCATSTKESAVTQSIKPKVSATAVKPVCPDGFCIVSGKNLATDGSNFQLSRYVTTSTAIDSKQMNPLQLVSDYQFSQKTRNVESAVKQILTASGYHFDGQQAQGVLPLLSAPLAVNQYSLKSLSAISAIHTLLGNDVLVFVNPITKAVRLRLSDSYIAKTGQSANQVNQLVDLTTLKNKNKNKEASNDLHDQWLVLSGDNEIKQPLSFSGDDSNLTNNDKKDAENKPNKQNKKSENNEIQALAHYSLVVSPFLSDAQSNLIQSAYDQLGFSMGFIKAVKSQHLVAYRNDETQHVCVAASKANAQLFSHDNVFYGIKGQSIKDVLEHWQAQTKVQIDLSDVPDSVLQAKLTQNQIFKGSLSNEHSTENVINNLFQTIAWERGVQHG